MQPASPNQTGKRSDLPARRKRLFTNGEAIATLDQPASLWNRLAFSTRQRDPFCCSSTWQLSFHEAFSPRRRLLVRQSEDSLLAFAEKVFSPGNVWLTPIEPLWFFGANVLGANGFALLEDLLPEIASSYHPRFPRIVISGLAPRGGALRQLKGTFEGRFGLHRIIADVQCGASLAGGLDGFLSRRSGNLRRKLRKQERRARDAGVGFERHSPALAAEAEKLFARMLAVEVRSWKGSQRCGMAERQPKKFYAAMLRRLAPSQDARIIFARHEGRDIGFIFGSMARDIYRGQQFSYDHEWSGHSIGNLLQLEQIGWLCEEGATRYDMGPLLGPGMEYKRHWTEERFHIETWVMEQNGNADGGGRT